MKAYLYPHGTDRAVGRALLADGSQITGITVTKDASGELSVTLPPGVLLPAETDQALRAAVHDAWRDMPTHTPHTPTPDHHEYSVLSLHWCGVSGYRATAIAAKGAPSKMIPLNLMDLPEDDYSGVPTLLMDAILKDQGPAAGNRVIEWVRASPTGREGPEDWLCICKDHSGTDNPLRAFMVGK